MAVSVEKDEASAWSWHVLHSDVADQEDGWPAHDPIKLGKVLSETAGA